MAPSSAGEDPPRGWGCGALPSPGRGGCRAVCCFTGLHQPTLAGQHLCNAAAVRGCNRHRARQRSALPVPAQGTPGGTGGHHTVPPPLPAGHPRTRVLSPTARLSLPRPCAASGASPAPGPPARGLRASLGPGSPHAGAPAPYEWAGGGPGAPPLPVASANQKFAAPPIRGLSLGRLEPGVKRERAVSHPSCKRCRPIRGGAGR